MPLLLRFAALALLTTIVASAQLLLPELQAARGAVVMVSSIHANLTKPGFAACVAQQMRYSHRRFVLTYFAAADTPPRKAVWCRSPRLLRWSLAR